MAVEYRPMDVLKRLHDALDTADLPGLDSNLGEFTRAVSWAISRLNPQAVCGWCHLDHGRCVRLRDHEGRCEFEDGTFSEKERTEIEAEFNARGSSAETEPHPTTETP